MIEAGTFLQQRYRIKKQIGQGGMGAVYVATDERFGSTVAIKETLCMDDNFRRAIEREARLLNSLKHSALPRVSDHFEEANSQFLVMEYIPGEDVGTMLETDHSTFSVEQVLKWADQLLDALDYLHNQEMPVIHRDIKPQNLKINSRGEIILLDFGLAKGNPTDASHQTAAKSVFGYSRNYASLEQIQGTGTDPRSDLYSLAATLYHLLTKIPPEDALTRAMSVLSQKPDPLIPACQVAPAIPAGVAGVLQNALDLNADERPGSAAEMRQMFRESENYAYLADNVTLPALPADARVFAQKTKLMAEGTRADGTRATDMKTELLPGSLSEVTSVRAATATGGGSDNLTDAPPARRRGFGAAAGAAIMLLLCGAVAGAIYMVKPSVFGMGTADGQNNPGSTTPAVSDTNTAGVTNSNSAGNGSVSSAAAVNTVPAPSRSGDVAARSTESAKSSKGLNSDKKSSQDDPDDEVTVNDPDEPDNMVFTERDSNGKVTKIQVNPHRRPPNPKVPSIFGMDLFPNGFDMKNLTPEQRKKVQRAIRNSQQIPVPNRPPANKPPTD